MHYNEFNLSTNMKVSRGKVISLKGVVVSCEIRGILKLFNEIEMQLCKFAQWRRVASMLGLPYTFFVWEILNKFILNSLLCSTHSNFALSTDSYEKLAVFHTFDSLRDPVANTNTETTMIKRAQFVSVWLFIFSTKTYRDRFAKNTYNDYTENLICQTETRFLYLCVCRFWSFLAWIFVFFFI